MATCIGLFAAVRRREEAGTGGSELAQHRGIHLHIGILRAVAQQVVHQRDGHHRLGDRRGTDAHARVVAALGEDDHRVAGAAIPTNYLRQPSGILPRGLICELHEMVYEGCARKRDIAVLARMQQELARSHASHLEVAKSLRATCAAARPARRDLCHPRLRFSSSAFSSPVAAASSASFLSVASSAAVKPYLVSL